MTSPPDVQNVPDVWGLLEQARDMMLHWATHTQKAARLRKELCDCIDAVLAQRDRFVLVPKEPVATVNWNPWGDFEVTWNPESVLASGTKLYAAAPKPPEKP